MPKLDATHLPERLNTRLADLKEGKSVSIRDIKALLNDEQIAAMEAAWQQQQELRKIKRARSKQEEIEFGWKDKRQIYIEAYENALDSTQNNLLSEYKKKMKEAEIRAAKIYLEEFFKAKADDKDYWQADAAAKNALSQAGFVSDITSIKMKARVEENLRMEKRLEEIIKSKMTPDELEQYELLQEHEQDVKNKYRKAK